LLLTSSRTLNLYQILNKAEVEKFETTIDSRERAKENDENEIQDFTQNYQDHIQ
jgi:hypothetical protein